MLKNWTQTIYLMLSCGAMLVGATIWLTSTIAASSETQRAYAASIAAADRDLVDNLAQQFQQAHTEMMQRVTKVEERQRFDDNQIMQSQASVDRLTVSLSELTKELSNLEGVIADGRKR